MRTAPNRRASAIRWRPDLLVTCDQLLPARDSFTLVLPGGGLAEAQTVRRDAAVGLAVLRLTSSDTFTAPPPAPHAVTGRLVLVLGAAFDASPTVRLAAIHRAGPTQPNGNGNTILLDLPGERFEAGSAVVDAGGGLLGMASLDPSGAAAVVPYDMIALFLEPQPTEASAAVAIPGAPTMAAQSAVGRRGWLGVALQPTTLPDLLRQLAGQPSGRMVVSITPKGPADHAGLQLGDVLLALDGHSVSGSHALRAVMNAEQVGRRLEVKLLRDGAIHVLPLVVAAQPVT